MQVRDLPIFFLVLVFAGLLLGVYYIRPYKPVVSIVPVAEEEPQWRAFSGRVVMPSLDDMYVLGNSADRNLLQFEQFLQGRAAGLHFAAADYFKKHNCAAAHGENIPDVVLGLKLTLDSLGMFEPEILFSNIADENFKGLVLSQIQTYWRYPRSEQGSLEVWVPVVWKSCYRHNSN